MGRQKIETCQNVGGCGPVACVCDRALMRKIRRWTGQFVLRTDPVRLKNIINLIGSVSVIGGANSDVNFSFADSRHKDSYWLVIYGTGVGPKNVCKSPFRMSLILHGSCCRKINRSSFFFFFPIFRHPPLYILPLWCGFRGKETLDECGSFGQRCLGLIIYHNHGIFILTATDDAFFASIKRHNHLYMSVLACLWISQVPRNSTNGTRE